MLQSFITEMNIDKSYITKSNQHFEKVMQIGNLVYTSGHGTMKNGSRQYCGKVGKEIAMKEACMGAELSTINTLISLENYLGDLKKIKKIIKVTGYVNSESSFEQHSEVMNASSNLLKKIFGEVGDHARTAIGVSSLPGNIPVEVEMIVEVQ